MEGSGAGAGSGAVPLTNGSGSGTLEQAKHTVFEDPRQISLFFAVLKWSLAILKNVLDLVEWKNRNREKVKPVYQ